MATGSAAAIAVTGTVEASLETLHRHTAHWQGYRMTPDEIRPKVKEKDLPTDIFMTPECPRILSRIIYRPTRMLL